MTNEAPLTILRPDKPRTGRRRVVKYETPSVKLTPARCYFSPIGGAHRDTAAPLLVTEGIKKVLAGCQARPDLAGLSWQGLYFHDAEDRRRAEDQRAWWTYAAKLSPEIADLPLAGRRVFLAFDSPDTRDKVQVGYAEARMVGLFRAYGANVYVVRMPAAPGDKSGLDDHLVRFEDPAAEFGRLLEVAEPADPVQRARAAAERGEVFGLVNDAGFKAALHLAEPVVVDEVKEVLSPKVARRSVDAAVRWVRDGLREHAEQERAHEVADRPEWTRDLARDDAGKIRHGAGNVLGMVEHLMGDWLSFDEFAGRADWLRSPPWEERGDPRPVDADHDGLRAVQWLEAQLGRWLAGSLRPTDATNAILTAAKKRAHNPVVEYLHGLEWDGEARLDFWAEVCLGVETDAHTVTYVRTVARRWMIAAVARAHHPGCKADNALVLEGPQGGGKSSAVAVLGGPWATEHSVDLASKDAYIELQGAWLVELSELAGVRKSQTEAVKKFLTSCSDRFRAPYERAAGDHPRRCVFVATTNAPTYLIDATGGRRFWPLRCGRIDVEGLRQIRDQLWAEAVVAYRAGERWWLDPTDDAAALRMAEEEQASRAVEDPWTERVAEYAEEMGDAGLSAREALERIGREDIGDTVFASRTRSTADWRPQDLARAVAIFQRVGWTDRRRQTHAEARRSGRPRQWRYYRPEGS